MKLSHRILLGFAVTLLILILLIALQNSDVVELRFLGWSFATTVLKLVLACAAIGALLGAATGVALTLRLSRRP
jgi:uncharacterized integral membrane protein